MDKMMGALLGKLKEATKPRWPWQKQPIQGLDDFSYPTVTGRMLALCLDLFLLTLLSPLLRIVTSSVYPAQTLAQEEAKLSSMLQAYTQQYISIQEVISFLQQSILLSHLLLQWGIALCVFGGVTSWCLARFGYTPGMWFFRYRLRTENLQETPSIGRIAWRYVLGVVSFGIGYIWVAFTKHRQAFHDAYSQTVMVKTPFGWKEKSPGNDSPSSEVE